MPIDDIFVQLLNSDMENMFKQIIEDYKEKIPNEKQTEFTLENLNRIFKISEIKRITDPQLPKPPEKKVIEDCHRCIARIWGSTPPIAYYCHQKKKYIYGERCSRPRKDGGDYCGLHKNRQPHGRYGELPPHEHFEKYLVTEN